jgi:zinc protease
MLRTLIACCAFVCATLVLNVHAAAVLPSPAPVLDLQQRLPTDPKLKIGKLANGLTYYIQKNSRPEKKVEMRLLLNVGSVLEQEDQQGLAHFIEHMAFHGSSHFKKSELTSYLQSIGVKFGADLSAFTSFNDTIYILQVPTDKKEYLESGFLILADFASGISFNEAEIERERHVVLEELRTRKGANERIGRELLPKLYPNSKYAERLPGGQEEQVKGFNASAMKRFYHDWYRPNLMAVIVVGDMEPQVAEKMIEKHFAKLKNPPDAPPRPETSITAPTQSEAIVSTDTQASNTSVFIRYGIQTQAPILTVDDYRQQIIGFVMSTVVNSRLQALVQQSNPPFGSAQGGLAPLEVGYQTFSVSAGLNRRGIHVALAALATEVKRLQKFGINQSELDRARKEVISAWQRQYNERDKTDSSYFVTRYKHHFLQQAPVPGLENEYRYASQLLSALTIEELNRFVLNAIPRNVAKLVSYNGITQPGSRQPTRAQLLEVVAEAEKGDIQAWAEELIPAQILGELPKAGSIVAESFDPQLKLTNLTLSNGIKVLLRPSQYRNDEIVMAATRDGGVSLFDGTDILNARYASLAVNSMGFKDLSPRQIHQFLAGKQVFLNMSMNAYNEFIVGSSAQQDLETLLQLIQLTFSAPRRDEALYEQFLTAQSGQTRGNLVSPEFQLQNAIQDTLFQSHPHLAQIWRAEDVQKLKLDDAIRIYQQRFGSAKDFTFIFVGNFEVANIKPLLSQYLASLPVPDVVTSWRDVQLRPVAGIAKKELRIGSDAKSTVTFSFSGPISASTEDRMRFYALIELLNLKITDTLREKQGYIYSGAAEGLLIPLPNKNYWISISLPCGPENVDNVIRSMLAEIRSLQQQGPNLTDLNKVKANWLKSYLESQRSNQSWLNYLLFHLKEPDTSKTNPKKPVSGEKLIAAMTAKQLQAAAQAFLNLNNYVQVVQNPDL